MTYFVPKDILFVVDKDDNVGDGGMLMMVIGYAQTQVVFFLVTYVVPMVGLSITYFHLGYVLWAAPNMRWGDDDDDKHGWIGKMHDWPVKEMS